MNHPMFSMMPPWWMPNPQWWQHGQQRPLIPDIIVPARVDKAIEFLTLLTHKTMTRAAATEHQIELIDGQKLTDEELTTMATACNLLNQYFAGQLKPDVWEGLKVDATRKQVDSGMTGPGKILHCISCGDGPPKPNCQFCHGTGTILVTAIGNPQTGGPSQPDDEQAS